MVHTKNSYSCYREPLFVDSENFLQWCEYFVKETKALQEKYEYFGILMDGIIAHKTFKALQYLYGNRFVVVALPLHTSHRTRSLVYCVFHGLKHIQNLLKECILSGVNDKRNDIYTLCDIMHTEYKKELSYENIVNGFRSCGIWCNEKKGMDWSVIK